MVANAGLIVRATLMIRLGLKVLVNSTVRWWAGLAVHCWPQVLTLVTTILAGGSHIDHADVMLATETVLPFRVDDLSPFGNTATRQFRDS